MTFYSFVLVVHVVVAVLGVGAVASIALIAATARRGGDHWRDVSGSIGVLLRAGAVSLAVMLLTGVFMDVSAGGVYHRDWWFRGSVLLMIVTGGLNAAARRTIRAAHAAPEGSPLPRVERLAYGMCVLVAAITALMEARPF